MAPPQQKQQTHEETGAELLARIQQQLKDGRAMIIETKPGSDPMHLIDHGRNLGVKAPNIVVYMDDTPNATMLTDGIMAVSSGMMTKFDKPELEAAMVHELEHQKLQHVQKLKEMMAKGATPQDIAATRLSFEKEADRAAMQELHSADGLIRGLREVAELTRRQTGTPDSINIARIEALQALQRDQSKGKQH